jgi:hypothetical protein
VKSNNDRSMDYTIPAGGPITPSHQGGPPQQHFNGGSAQNAPIPAASYVGPGQELLMGGGGGMVGAQDPPPSGHFLYHISILSFPLSPENPLPFTPPNPTHPPLRFKGHV